MAYHPALGPELLPEKAYPSYALYERLMQQYAELYPSYCSLEEWGRLASGRRILALRITNRAYDGRPRPEVLCTATMHGDEIAGYWASLRMAEHLLRERPAGLLNETVIYINPLANPDGAFMAGNHSLFDAQRGNANNVDLNRNYPDPDDGPHPDSYDYQPETLIFMRAARNHSFDLAINLHGGAELFNYPWDTYRHRHPDTDWWRRVSRDFARRAQADGSGYFTDRHDGITNGHDWYPISGSRQDYMNYYHRTREATVEVSMTKLLPAHQLPRLWGQLRPALLGYFAEARYGLHGRVTDTYTGRPVRAEVRIPGHDRDHSSVFSDAEDGGFFRFLPPGSYTVQVRAEGYAPVNRRVRVETGKRTPLEVELLPVGVPARK